MIKLIALFGASLLIIGSARFFEQQLSTMDIVGSLVAPSGSTARPVKFTPLPEDVLPFSANDLQKRYGCETSSSRFIGFTTRPGTPLAVLRDGVNETLYALGDALPGKDVRRVIWLDAQRLIVRKEKGIDVLCRDGTKVLAAQVVSPPPSQPAPQSEKVWSSALGEISQVVNSQGAITGYRLQQCRRYCWLLKQASLQTGDVITAVQGIPVTNLSITQIKDTAMKQQQDIHLTVERAGQQHQITLPWSRIAPMMHFIKGDKS